MIGYHYTTRKAWELIQQEGLTLAPMLEHEYAKFRDPMPRLQRDVVWVWKQRPWPEHAWVIAIGLAALRDSFNLVLLKIRYEDEDAASVIYNDHRDDSVLRLTASFTTGKKESPHMPVELLTHPVPPEDIEVIWETDLLAPFKEML